MKEEIWGDVFYLGKPKKHSRCRHAFRNVIGKPYMRCIRKGCGATKEREE
jgi:hypothetical protein